MVAPIPKKLLKSIAVIGINIESLSKIVNSNNPVCGVLGIKIRVWIDQSEVLLRFHVSIL